MPLQELSSVLMAMEGVKEPPAQTASAPASTAAPAPAPVSEPLTQTQTHSSFGGKANLIQRSNTGELQPEERRLLQVEVCAHARYPSGAIGVKTLGHKCHLFYQ